MGNWLFDLTLIFTRLPITDYYSMRSIYFAIPIMILLAIIQATIMPKFPILGFVPVLAFLVATAWGMLHTLEQGLAWAFIGGLFIDMFSMGPIGATSLAMMAAVTVVILIKRNFPESRVLLPVILGFLASMVFWFFYLLILRIVVPFIIGDPALGINLLLEGTSQPGLSADITRFYTINQATFGYGLLLAFGHALLILPVYWAIYTVERLLTPRRVEI
jgi:rod shape-determining protein MreD